MSKKLILEKIEGLPNSYDPYAPLEEVEHEGEIDGEIGDGLEGDELEGFEDKSDDEPEEDDLGDDFSLEEDGLGDDFDEGFDDEGFDEEEKDEIPYWEPVSVPNKKDICFKRSDGFYLRARRLESVPNKWIAQLWSGDKILDKGSIFIGNDLDPGEYLQRVADYMLDNTSRRYTQERMFPLEPDEDQEPEENAPEEDQEPEDTPEEELDLDLSDEDFQFE